MTRIEAAKRRAAGAKRTVAATSAAGFVAVLLLARASHPGHATTSHATASTSSQSPIAAATGTSVPQVQTHVS